MVPTVEGREFDRVLLEQTERLEFVLQEVDEGRVLIVVIVLVRYE